jgi:hypothetical protein
MGITYEFDFELGDSLLAGHRAHDQYRVDLSLVRADVYGEIRAGTASSTRSVPNYKTPNPVAQNPEYFSHSSLICSSSHRSNQRRENADRHRGTIPCI